MLLSRSKVQSPGVYKRTCPPLAMGWLLLSEPLLPGEHMHPTQDVSKVLDRLLILLLFLPSSHPLTHHTCGGSLVSLSCCTKLGPRSCWELLMCRASTCSCTQPNCSLSRKKVVAM